MNEEFYELDFDDLLNENNYSNATMSKYMCNRWKNRRLDAIKKLGGKCKKCGSSKNLEFHHRSRKVKDAAISKWSSMSDEKFAKELGRTELLCKSCHKKETKKQFSKGTKTVKEALEQWKFQRELEEAKIGHQEFLEKRALLISKP